MESRLNIIEFLRDCKFFSKMPIEKIVEIAPDFEIIHLEPNDILFSQGDASDYLYVVVKGELISTLTKKVGTQIVVGTIRTLETVGELGAMSSEPRSLTVEALTTCELLRLSSDKFKMLCRHFPLMQIELSNLIIQRSIKTIKMIGVETKPPAVTIVIPFLEGQSTDAIEKIIGPLIEKQESTLLNVSKMTSSDIIDRIHDKKQKTRSLVILATPTDTEIVMAAINARATFYIVFSVTEQQYRQETVSDFLNLLKLHPINSLELVLLHPENSKQLANTRKWLQIAKFKMHHHIRLNNMADYKRLARFVCGNAFTVVFGGGGAKGLVHLGVLKAVLEMGLPIDAIGGTSIGANVASCYALHLNYQRVMTSMNQLKKSTVKSLSLLNMTWPVVAFFSSSPATQELQKQYGSNCIEDVWIPLFCVSSNITKMRQEIHRRGLMWEAVRCSASVPGIYPPFMVNGSMLVDGGLLNNLPVDIMRDLIGPGHTILAVSLANLNIEKQNYSFPPIITFTQALLKKLGLGYRSYVFPPFFETFRSSLLLGSSNKEKLNSFAADMIVKPDLGIYRMLSVTKKGEQELIDIGYNETKKILDRYFTEHPDVLKRLRDDDAPHE